MNLFNRKQTNKNSFDKLFSYFKWLVGASYTAIFVLVVVASVILGRNLSDIKQSASSTATETAETIAKEASRKKIEEVFQQPNIQTMIDSAARKEIAKQADRITREYYEKNKPADVATISLMNDAVSRMNNGRADGLVIIIKIMSDASVDGKTKAVARTYLERAIHENPPGQGASVSDRLSALGLTGLSKDSTVASLVSVIRQQEDMYTLINASLTLQNLSGGKFSFSDVPNIDRWYRNFLRKSNRHP